MTTGNENPWAQVAAKVGEQVLRSMQEMAKEQNEQFTKFMALSRSGAPAPEALQAVWKEMAEETGRRVVAALEKSMALGREAGEQAKSAWDAAPKGPGPAEVYDIWKKYWTKSLEATRTAGERWREGGGPDLDSQKEFYNLWLEANSELMKLYLRSPLFASLLGQNLSRGLEFRQQTREMVETMMRNAGAPTKGDIDEVIRKVQDLDRKVEAVRKALNDRKAKK